MEIKKYIILINFNTLVEGIEFVNSFNKPFSFLYNNQTYNSNGDVIDAPLEYTPYEPNQIYVSLSDSPVAGELYVEDGFLTYFKEIGNE